MNEHAQSNGAAIRTDQVQRHYQMGDTLIRAVDGVSLEIPAGQFLALLDKFEFWFNIVTP